MALSVLLPEIKKDMALSDSQLGLLVGFAFSVFYAVCGIPIARLADRTVRKNVIVGALAVWSVMTALSGAALNFWHLFAARVGIGAGEAGCIPPAQSVICDYVRPSLRAGVLAFHSFGMFVGMMTGMAAAGWLADAVGWRWTFAVFGISGIGLALLVWLTLREPVRGAFDKVGDRAIAAPTLRVALDSLRRKRTYVFIVSFAATNGFVQYGLNQWWPSFFARTYGLPPGSVGLPLGVAIAAGSGFGLLLGGFAASKCTDKHVKLPLALGAASVLLAIPAALGSIFAESFALSILFVGLSCLLWCVPHGPVMATQFNITRPDMRATAGAVPIFFTSIVGFGLGPLTVGLLSDMLAPSAGADSLRYALLAPVAGLPIMALVLWGASRSLVVDLDRSDSIKADHAMA